MYMIIVQVLSNGPWWTDSITKTMIMMIICWQWWWYVQNCIVC